MPPVIGYCAVSGHFDLAAALLFVIFSLWQMPHSYAIAILHLNDYAAAGIPVLPVKEGIATAKKHIVFYIIAFSLAALMLGICGYAGTAYLVVTAGLGGAWLYMALSGYHVSNERAWARKMFLFSIICIMALSVMMSLDYKIRPSGARTAAPATQSGNMVP
jgi:protoheme IX farnesyltransferase